jgi:Type VI secretion system/phage-baseplate injector OB domain
MIEEFFDNLEVSIEGIKKKYYGVVTGRVINQLDPLSLGRVQVQLPFIDSLDLSPWARVATPLAGPLCGFYFIPNVGDEVLVAFEQGDSNVPYVFGGLWSAFTPPPLPSPLPQVSMIKTLAQNTIMFTDIPPTITIMTPAGQTILMSAAGVQIMSDPKDLINITPAGIQVLSGTNVLNIGPAGISIAGGPNVSITATTSVSISAPTINLVGAQINLN